MNANLAEVAAQWLADADLPRPINDRDRAVVAAELLGRARSIMAAIVDAPTRGAPTPELAERT